MTDDRSPRDDAIQDAPSNEPTFRLGPPEGARVARGGELHVGEPQLNELDTTFEESERDLDELFSTEPPPFDTAPPLGIETDEDKTVWVDDEEWEREEAQREQQQLASATVENSPAPPNGGGPPDDSVTSDAADETPNPPSRDREMGLLEHLAELRTRLLYCFLALALGTSVAWSRSLEFQAWFAAPIVKALEKNNGILISIQPTGFFTLTLSFSLIAGLILVMPFILFQVWRFIEPALTNNERRYGLVLVPFSSVLFFLGAGLGYAVSPLFFQFFLQFQPENIAAQWDYFDSVMLMAKMLLTFGIMFQVPVVIIFLSKIGLLTRDVLIEYWRHAVIAIFLLAAVLTPTWDPVSLAVCATPPCLLYILSIWLVKWL